MGKKDKLKEAIREVNKEIINNLEGVVVEVDEEDSDDEEDEIMYKILEIRANILRYVLDRELDLCEYMSIKEFGNFLNKVLLTD